MSNKSNPPHRERRDNVSKSKLDYYNSLANQRKQLVDLFREKPQRNTLELRSLGIMHPGGRIMELRQAGHTIHMHWIKERDGSGQLHRVGMYVYQGKAGGKHAG